MDIYVALLRGINVGGKNIVKMAELKKLMEGMGLNEVKTYIQSGNILFKFDENEEVLVERLEAELKPAFGFSIPVILRTVDEIQAIIKNCPFSKEQIAEAEAASEAESLYVALLDKIPEEEKHEALKKYKSENEDYCIIGREVYLLFKDSIRNSKLAGNLHRLGVQTTTRNWKTMNKLCEMANEMRD